MRRKNPMLNNSMYRGLIYRHDENGKPFVEASEGEVKAIAGVVVAIITGITTIVGTILSRKG